MFWHEDAFKIRHIWMDWTHSPDANWRAAKKMAKRPLRSAQGLMGILLFYHTPTRQGMKIAPRGGGEGFLNLKRAKLTLQ